MKKPSVRVLVVDPHLFVRRSICTLLSQDPTLEVICESADGEGAIQKAKELKPDLVLLDVSLPGISGLEAAQLIRRVSPESQIIFVSQHDSFQIVNAAMKVGGLGYITKNSAGKELLKGIHSVRKGLLYVSQEIIDLGWMPEI